ncbi:MAG TPA: hypothetical protein VGP15_00625 [Burkholderiales bacterium]|nr:hypothetical protein [Burkholderiales bacterium]
MQASTPPKQKFSDLASGDKVKFVVKFMIFLVTFGFAFPLLLSD